MNDTTVIIVAVLAVINIVAIFFIVSKRVSSHDLSMTDKAYNITQGLSKIEAHLVNYDKDTIAFSHLSAIEREVGLAKEETHNEIWVITNDFEENNDSVEGAELRAAILDNLASNVDYYFIVSRRHEDELKVLSKKLSAEKGGRNISRQINYYVNDAFDFIPTPYYDIILYIKDDPSSDNHIESSSQFYYCFSRNTDAGECFYQKVEEKDVWDRLRQFVMQYKKEHSNQQMTMAI